MITLICSIPTKLIINNYFQTLSKCNSFKPNTIQVNRNQFYISVTKYHIIWFLTLSDNLFTLNHWVNLFNSLFYCTNQSNMIFIWIKILMSSAKIMKCNKSDTLNISLMYNINNEGPRIDPCGTPQRMFRLLDLPSWNWTYYNLLDYDLRFESKSLFLQWYFNRIFSYTVCFEKYHSGAPNRSVPQNICSYGISSWLARKRNR